MQDLFQNVIDEFGIFTAHFDIIKITDLDQWQNPG
jgi:hypothetical protein